MAAFGSPFFFEQKCVTLAAQSHQRLHIETSAFFRLGMSAATTDVSFFREAVSFKHDSSQVVDVLEAIGTEMNTTVPSCNHHQHVLRIHNLHNHKSVNKTTQSLL